jgi:hypothetical protein
MHKLIGVLHMNMTVWRQRLSRSKRGYRRIGILLALTAWIAAMGVGDARRATAQPECLAAQCVYIPMVAHALPIQIVSSYSFLDDKGTAYAVDGVIAASTSQAVYDVTLEARFYDAGNQLVGTATITPALAANLPGWHNRFSYKAPDTSFRPARYELTVRTWATTSARDYRPITVVSAQRSGGGELGYIRGVIRNDQPQALSDIVIVAEWDDTRSSYGIARIAHLEPGATASIEVGYVYPSPAYSTIPPVVQGVGYTSVAARHR